MKIGKLPTEVLEKCVINNIKVKRPEVLVHSAIGEDCSIIGFGEHCCVLSTDPITGSSSSVGYLAVNISCNDIAASGVEPLGVLVTILAPPSVTEKDIYELMEEINEASAKINVEILGGHTEITDAVNRIVVSTTAIGKGPIDKYVTTSGAEADDYIIVTKSAGLEGTSIIASDYEDYLKDKVSQDTISKAKSFIDKISVVKEGIIGGKVGVSSMHDVTEGGILGAVWEVAEASGKGFEIYEEFMPIAQETREICRVFGLNPLRLISSGMMLITTKNREELLEALSYEGIDAECIGKITQDKNTRVLFRGGKAQTVLPPQPDELFNINL
ncbi:hydrogenase isoenzymes formation protein HypE [Oxobacter pfennigii]|uniref:Hydrogenase isoenzymes formation protein HypE n=1 Tax=Oxobacter pfennigii TaxID=36849 RepID=A0A0P8WDF3_9CLOT|nr:AIR synthase family protein [Oxobacter pfennigii]KPU45946.1 hydrogenase isoenzymes formation protein HypE [Oxobacter pfennigii]